MKNIESILASMNFEGFEFTPEEVKKIEDIYDGRISIEEACKKIIDEIMSKEGVF